MRIRMPRRRRPAPGRSRLDITTILLNGERAVRHLRTPPNQFWSPNGIEHLLEQEAERVESFFPGREFRLVPLRDGNFNFVEVKLEIPPHEAEGVECAELKQSQGLSAASSSTVG